MTINNHAVDGNPLVHRTLKLLAAVVMVIGLLTAGAGAETASATTTTYGFWDTRGCYKTWQGLSDGWRQGTCHPANYMRWSGNQEINGVTVRRLEHWNDQVREWQFQALFLSGTMDIPNGILVVPFGTQQDLHLFVYDFATDDWYHFYKQLQSVQAAPINWEVETNRGWVTLADMNSPVLSSMIAQWEKVQQ